MNETLAALARHWGSTCKLMFGAPIGDLLDFESYLYSEVVRPSIRTSCMGGEEVVVLPEIRPEAKVASYD
jgi:hypothetical protein